MTQTLGRSLSKFPANGGVVCWYSHCSLCWDPFSSWRMHLRLPVCLICLHGSVSGCVPWEFILHAVCLACPWFAQGSSSSPPQSSSFSSMCSPKDNGLDRICKTKKNHIQMLPFALSLDVSNLLFTWLGVQTDRITPVHIVSSIKWQVSAYCMNEYMWMDRCMDEWMMDEWLVNARINEWMDTWINEYMVRWMNEWLDDW